MTNKIKGFATNNLVSGHDNYIKFMKKRWDYIKKEGKPTEVLFCKRGLVVEAFGINTKEDQMKLNTLNKDLTLWHCIVLSYDIWYDCVKDCVEEGHGSINYKKFVNVSDDILRKFKYRFEQSIKNAKCDYKRYTNPDQRNCLNACRYLVRFWTYLDLAKDCKTQRFFPNAATIKRAAKIFGYGSDENPFIMNGKFRKNAVRSNSEEKPVKETVCVTNSISNDTLLVDIIDDRRLTNPLWRAGIQTVGEFRNKTDKELLKIRTFGVSKLKHMREYIDKLAPEESVIDIAEQAAKEVEEERTIPESPSRELREIFNKLKNDYDALDAKYDTLLRNSKELARQNDDLLKSKTEMETFNIRLRDELQNLRAENENLKERNSNLSIAANPNNLDTFTLINTILEKMKHSKMEYILLTIDGMTIDIHPKSSMNFPSNYKAYINNKREV